MTMVSWCAPLLARYVPEECRGSILSEVGCDTVKGCSSRALILTALCPGSGGARILGCSSHLDWLALENGEVPCTLVWGADGVASVLERSLGSVYSTSVDEGDLGAWRLVGWAEPVLLWFLHSPSVGGVHVEWEVSRCMGRRQAGPGSQW